MYKCEKCGREADIHHIVHRNEGGLDFPLNYKYLCPKHHRGKNGPHRNYSVDMEYKLEMQNKLEDILKKDFYHIEELILLLELNKSKAKKYLKDIRLYKEGYKTNDIIHRLMGKHKYNDNMLFDFEDMFIVNISV